MELEGGKLTVRRDRMLAAPHAPGQPLPIALRASQVRPMTSPWRPGGAALRSSCRDAQGDVDLAYDAAGVGEPARPDVSISPLGRVAPFNRRDRRPVFADLLPEEAQRAAGASVLGVSTALSRP
ncbi:hypothetical protein [Phenylobacterium sp.]|uniref:hypothetical protein n=1 Tax=Phenylobacterium sp. TaxID=1871053 RepID=UPI0035B05002